MSKEVKNKRAKASHIRDNRFITRKSKRRAQKRMFSAGRRQSDDMSKPPKSDNIGGGDNINDNIIYNALALGGNPDRRNRKLDNAKKIAYLKKIKGGKLDENDSQNNPENLDCFIYLDTDDSILAQNYYNKLLELVRAFDFDLKSEEEAIKGSWIKKFKLSTKNFFGKKEVQDGLGKIEKSLDLNHIGKVQSEIAVNKSVAISNFLDATKDFKNAVTTLENLLIVKATINDEAQLFIQTMTESQQKTIEQNPSLLYKPQELFYKMEILNKEILLTQKKASGAGN